MSIPPVVEFQGQLPVEGEPASFPARAEALFEWLVGQGMPTFNAAIAAVNIALNDNGTVLDTAGKAIALTTNAGTLVETSGVGDAYTITPAVAVAAYEVGQTFMVRPHRTNGGPITLRVGALSAQPVRKVAATGSGFVELAPGDWRPGEIHIVSWRGTQFELLSVPLNSFVRTDSAQTVSGLWEFSARPRFAAGLTSTAIGQIEQGTGAFTALASQSHTVAAPEFAAVDLRSEAAPDTHKTVRVVRGPGNYALTVVNHLGVFVQTGYDMIVGAAGAVSHVFRIAGVDRLTVLAGGVQVSGSMVVTGGAQVDGNLDATDIRPRADNASDLGSVFRYWRNIFLRNAPIVASDARLKKDIRPLSDAELRAAARLPVLAYSMRDGGQGKIGYVAQDVIAAFAAEGLCAVQRGLVIDGGEYLAIDMDAINALQIAALRQSVLGEAS